MSKPKVGVVGVGAMGQRHCRVYSEMREVNFVGLHDANSAHGQMMAKIHGTMYFESYEALLDQVDAINIVTPTHLHFALAAAAIERGVDVLVEKPITESVDEGQALVDLARAHECLLQVGHIERFNPVYSELKSLAQEMEFIAVNVRRLSSFTASNTDVDVIHDLMIHDLDLVMDLLGDSFDAPSAMGRSISTSAIDHAIANLSYAGGPMVSVVASRITEQKVRSIEIVADGAYIEADLLAKTLTIHRQTRPQYLESSSKYRQVSFTESIHVPNVEPLKLELRHFVECVQYGRAPLVTGEDGLRALQLASTLQELIQQPTLTKVAA